MRRLWIEFLCELRASEKRNFGEPKESITKREKIKRQEKRMRWVSGRCTKSFKRLVVGCDEGFE
jgi:hypothetical protein